MAARRGEVVTLQLGHYANCVGAHWWSLQEAELSQEPELCSDVLFRRGAETYTPRLISLDLKGSIRSLREEGCSDDNSSTRHCVPAWSGNVSVHREDPDHLQGEDRIPRDGHKGQCQALPSGGITEKSSTAPISSWVWSDILQTRLHPKSLCIVNSHSHEGGMDGLESFSQGEAMFKTQLEEVEDRLHFFTEECDYLQGFQLLCDIQGGFSAVGVRMAELLHDEYPGRGILSFGTCPAPPEEMDPCKAVYQLLNCILALGPLSSYSSLFCPLSVMSSLGRRSGSLTAFPHLLYNASLHYHSSAVLAVALNTLTVPYRMASSDFSMLHFAEMMTFSGRKILSASCSVPFPLRSSMCLPDALLPHLGAAPWCSVSPCTGDAAIFSQSVVFRGIPEPWHTSDLHARTRPPSTLHTCETEADVLQRYLSTLYPYTVNTSHVLGAPCTLGPSFPQFFSSYVTKDGFTTVKPQTEAAVVGQIPVLGALQTSSALHQMLCSLCDEASKMDVRQWLNFSTAAVEQDDFREAVDEVRSLAHHYCTREGNETDDSD
ncbi:protein misato homolog 1 isoform X1 [Ranitomeya variabilis]|uniref:protein misato homolog 1 isoform X1 n=1 Tax=Ranitomeya variabilis TaxID=490064 RepID=UPI00405607DB